MRIVIATHNRKKAGEMVAILSRRFPKLEIKTLADYPGAPEPEETGETYAENAAIKALSAAAFTGELCIADDAGLEIDALDGAPGHMSKRFGGEDLLFPEKMARILKLMKDVPEEKRTARFRCCVAVAGRLTIDDCRLTNLGPEGTGGQGDEGTEGQVAGRRSQVAPLADLHPQPLPPLASLQEEGASHPLTDSPSPPLIFESTCDGRIAYAPSGSGGFGYDPIFYLPDRGCCMADLSADQKHSISHRGKVLALFGDWLEEKMSRRVGERVRG
ncbi:MAG: hypothetical protein HZC36_14390 [Armatimonadetes bacterium]|nr:hypothetical protein [Armatimonadota bacterium]